MFDEPDEQPAEDAIDPADRAREKSDEFRMHAELFAVFEGNRKFDAGVYPNLDGELARQIQKTIARLEKSKTPDSPVLPPHSAEDAANLLNFWRSNDLSTNDYHIYARPGEVMIVRWLEGEQVQTFYERIQAHFDVALTAFRDEERQSHEWKQDPQTLAYLKVLDAIEVKMEEWYHRPLIRARGFVVLSSRAVDEMSIAHLCDYIMGVPISEVVGRASAPGDEPTQRDLAWFFKLFSLRGMREGVEQMCFFTYLQKSEDTFSDW